MLLVFADWEVMMKSWSLEPGQPIVRKQLHSEYGGKGQGGICPSRLTDNVMLFTSESGDQYGYSDRLGDDGCFHYTGEGQIGPQSLNRGNRSVLDHREKGRSIRLFKGSSGSVRYIGEFALDSEKPFYFRSAPDVKGEERQVVVFRLRPVGEAKLGALH
jgi:hypothetical protein